MSTPRQSIDDLPLQWVVTESVAEQFALSHTPTDILRELVQNEYDAGGRELGVHFGGEELVITGNGDPIDAAGWKRLGVMLGTGSVPNSDTYIEPKKSNIGSKNFGLRSLFTVGDGIWVYSDDKYSVLHCQRGSLYPPGEALGSPRRGVRIEVPYRREKRGSLEPFTPERRTAWVQETSASLTETLIKLAHPGRSRSLRRVVLTDDDGLHISWKQRAEEVPTSAKGVRLVRRQAVRESGDHRESVVELEYQAKVRIPEAHRQQDFPEYFRHNRSTVWIGVSLRLNRGRPDMDSEGLVYYPLGAPLARTGNHVSLNAPFELDNNRANIVSPSLSSWNQWLIEESVDLTLRLLTADWYERFGAGAYLALQAEEHGTGNQLIESYADAVVDRLQNEMVWATRGRSRGRVKFAFADELALPDRPEFDGFLELDQYLDGNLSTNPRLVELALGCGAERFGPASLVRLRCAGTNATTLRTRPQDQGQGSWSLSDFERQIRQLATQVKFARALEKVRLTPSQRSDLLDSPTTLAADGTLQALSEPLQVVPSDGWEACPVPLSQSLHPDLADFGVLTRLAKKFNMNEWIRSTARRAKDDQASIEERKALMNVILTRSGRFDARTRSVLRSSPVLLDHFGRWTEPRKITLRGSKGAKALGPVLSFPARAYARHTALARRLSFRNEIDGEDLVNLAEWVGAHPDKALQFETALLRFRNLVKRSQWQRLREIECLRSSNGGLEAPRDLYVRTNDIWRVLGEVVSYVVGTNTTLHERMGCNVFPLSSDIASVIEQNRQSATRTAELIYPNLVEALRRERLPVTAYADEAIVLTQWGYSPPSETLLRPTDPSLFVNAIAVATPNSARITDALRALGCRGRPVREDWLQLIISISQSVGSDGMVSNSDRSRLLRAYAELRNDVSDLAGRIGRPFVLGRDGYLRHPSNVYIDDFPQLTELLGERVSFAEDSTQTALSFYLGCGVKKLSEAVVFHRPSVGDTKDGPNRLGATKTRRQLASDSFISAFSALVNRETADRPGLAAGPLLATQFPRVESLIFVDFVSQECKLGDISVELQPSHFLDGATLYVAWTQRRTAFRDAVSLALAEAVTGSSGSAQLIAPAIYRLLECNTTEEITEYLAQRGIPWRRHVPLEIWDVEGETAGDGSHQAQDRESIAEQIRDSLTANLLRRASQTKTGSPTSSSRTSTTQSSPKRRLLPPIDEVVTREIAVSGTHISTSAGGAGSGGGGGGGGWSSRDPEWDRRIGERGEEIVYLREIERVRAAGLECPESSVIWVARDDPTADHDIRSVTEDGRPLWIEVKSTSGLHGHFDWPESEVAKAMTEREGYVLCRVYQADTRSPLVKCFRDPLSMVESGQMRLGLGSVRAQVESAGTSQEISG